MTWQTTITHIQELTQQSTNHLPFLLSVIAVIWLINIANWLTGSHLNILGVIPRNPIGLVGILYMPILHGDFNHLISNTVALFGLSIFLLSKGLNFFIHASILISLLSGFLIWCCARPGIHIGASAVISGYFGYILAEAYLYPTTINYFFAALSLFYFNGIFLGFIPQGERIGWDSHILGFIAGIITIYVYI